MGGLVARAAIPHLDTLKAKFHTYISMSSPHLGYMYHNNSSKLFDTGMWFLKKWNKNRSLTQLSMGDADKVENQALYKLAAQQSLNEFMNVVLVCSNQDQYVPFDSARIQICKEALTDDNQRQKGNQYIQMTMNLMQNLKAQILYRIDVDFLLQVK